MTTKTTKSMIGAATLAAALLAAACSSSSSGGGTDAGTGGTTTGTGGAAMGSGGAPGTGGATPADGGGNDTTGNDGGIPAPPTLGAQIDRMGRPAINTAITAPFAAAATHDMNQDMYNAATPSTAMTFEAAFEANLAILDSLDRNCGNQFAADKTKTDATRYKPLADVLLDDQLYVDTSSGTCAVYLGVEANATNIIPNTDCGGRTLTEDVADVSYSVLATGMVSGVTDGVAADDKTTSATFPFLAAPN